MAEGARAAPAPSSPGFSGAERVGGDLEGPLVLPALRLRYEPDLLEQGQQTLSLLRLLPSAETRLGPLPDSVYSRRANRTDRAGADHGGGRGVRAPPEEAQRYVRAQ